MRFYYYISHCLHGKLKAVEESPGLTIFDMIGPKTTVSVDYKSRK